MNNEEAKFILSAYRPDGRDAEDPKFAGALAQAENDPELRAWLEKSRRFDAAVSSKLAEITPPPGLREAILAGARVSSQQPRRWWAHPSWLAAAAAIVMVAALTLTLRPGDARPRLSQLAAVALNDLVTTHDNHSGFPAGLGDVQAQLASAPAPLQNSVSLDLDELRRKRCRTVRVAGAELFEICFQRDGTWFHLYVGQRKDFGRGSADPKSLIATRDGYSSTVWADAQRVYALVAHVQPDTLRNLF